LLAALGSPYYRRPNGCAIGDQINAAFIVARADSVNVLAHKAFDYPPKGVGLRSNMGNCSQHCQTSKGKPAYENEKKPYSRKINPHAYPKWTVGRVAATPAPKIDRVGRTSRTPQPAAYSLFERPYLASACSRRRDWSTVPPKRWMDTPSASLNPSHSHVSPNPHLYRASAKDSRRPAAPTSRMGAARWRVAHL
jgi:hypothetical protein